MTQIRWKEAFSVGVPSLDDDHRLLISIMNRVDDAVADGNSLEWVLQELETYARDHFAREEKMLKAANFPEFAAHQRDHAAFLERLPALSKASELSRDTYYHFGETIGEYLKEWLINHVLKTDMEYKGKLH